MMLEQSLLDLIAIQMDCAYLSDLKFLNSEQQKYLAQKLEPLTPYDEDLMQWNDALVYLTNAPPEASAYMAKTRLIQYLLQPSEKQHGSTR